MKRNLLHLLMFQMVIWWVRQVITSSRIGMAREKYHKITRTQHQPMPCTQAQRRKVMVFEWCGCKRHGKWKNDTTYYTMSCTRTLRRIVQRSQLVKKQHHGHCCTYKANKRGGNNTMISVKHKGKNKTSRKIVGLDKGLVFYWIQKTLVMFSHLKPYLKH